jgi:chromosome segregation protein SMC, common bacterial type
MYLKSLEIQGFKSFANKIVFEFHNGITAIVGPNGSGKSNVSDAVRWVLGEQSAKQLRGGNMQDVIFAGTENRKPLGFAYVAITLDNSDRILPIDFKEVKVARRVYRSGESEYSINGKITRLKDVHELFYDTGIGKEGYSIIGQGQIDKILSGRPEERRELFDEAAGIVKFKRRKVAAQKKLEGEKANLIRVNDILSELTKQLGPLERQSNVAREYLKNREQLKIYDVNMFLLEMTRIKKQLEEVDKKIVIATNGWKEASEVYENAKLENGDLQKQLEVIEQRIEVEKDKANDLVLKEQRLEAQINLLKEQIKTTKLGDEHIKDRIKIIEKEIQEKEVQRQGFQKEKDQLASSLEILIEKQRKVAEQLEQSKMSNAKAGEELEDANNEVYKIMSERAVMEVSMQRFETMREQISIRRAELNKQIFRLQSEESVQELQIAENLKELEEVTLIINKLELKQKELDTAIISINEKLMRMSKELESGQTTYHKETSKLESLRNLTERYEGYGNSIRRIMELKEKKSGILGVVADIIKVEKNYEVAIETALGGSIQNVVTDTETTAKMAIEYLKQNKYGRATFLPLNSMNNRSGSFQNEKALKELGVIGLASSLVLVDEKFKGIAGFLLGRTLVVDNIDNGISLAKKYQYSLRIVTLEGESLTPGGSMTGGAFRNNSNLLGRRREIEEIEANIQGLKAAMEKAQADVEQTRGLRVALRGELAELKEQLNQENLQQNTVKIKIAQYQSKKEEINQNAIALNSENNEIEKQLEEIKSEKEEIKIELNNSVTHEAELKGFIQKIQNSIEQQKEQEQQIAKRVEQGNVEIANLEQKLDFANQNLKRVQSEVSRLSEEKDGVQVNAKDTLLEVQKKEVEIEQIIRSIETTKGEKEEAHTQTKNLQKNKDELSVKYRSFFNKQEELSKQMGDLDKESYRLQNQKEKMEETSEQQTKYMWAEYELTLRGASELRNEDYSSLSALKKDIAQVKAKIRELGDVNVNAIEAYKELQERHTFLEEQYNDLIIAEASLQKIIEELDEGMRKQFTEKFAEIQREFDVAFKQLFGGGKGTIELLDDDDILEAGVSIISQPPGKKLQNMMQLSGGEKALTAIALLFAIQNLKPSPFCLLDEIEAALDDSNVIRYAKYLNQLTEHTQFIIITHRRGTMAAADRLYGITMQEKGVSALVSVNLIEDDLDE